jgi:hypothetical protein
MAHGLLFVQDTVWPVKAQAPMKPTLNERIRRMRKVFLSLMLLAVSMSAFPQEHPSIANEFGLIFSNLNSFGLRYKCGNDKTMFRLTSLVLNGTSTINSYDNYSVNGIDDSDISNSTANSIGYGLNLGIEKRKWITDNFCVYGGFDWINSYTRTRNNTITPSQSQFTYTEPDGAFVVLSSPFNNASNSVAWTISSGLGIALGTSYNVGDLFRIAAELEPTISYKYTKTTTSTSTYNVHWAGSANAGYTPSQYLSSSISQETVNKGFTGSFTNAAASIVISYVLQCPAHKKQ